MNKREINIHIILFLLSFVTCFQKKKKKRKRKKKKCALFHYYYICLVNWSLARFQLKDQIRAEPKQLHCIFQKLEIKVIYSKAYVNIA